MGILQTVNNAAFHQVYTVIVCHCKKDIQTKKYIIF